MSVHDNETVCVIACQGPPRCAFEGEAAVQHQLDGCIWCEVHRRLPSGEWEISRPGET